MATDARNHARAPLAAQLLVLAVAIVATLAGLWVFGSPLAGAVADALNVSRWWTSIAFCVIWFVLASVILGKLRKQRPEFKVPLRIAFLVPVIAAGGAFAYSSLHDTTVNDKVARADVKASDLAALPPANQAAPGVSEPEIVRGKPMNIELSSGSFSGIDHSAKGDVKVIRLAKGGNRLTLTNVDIENAPDLRLYMAVDEVDGDVGEYKEIARLKGNKGNQQYKLPGSLDLKKYDVVVVWCKAFDVGVAQAPLKAS